MSASAFSPYSFSRALRAGDSSRFGVDLKANKAGELAKAAACARDPSALSTYQEIRLGSKEGVAYSDYAVTLVLRSLASNIRYRTGIRMPSRDSIIKGVLQSVRDATPMAIFRRDITSFYESLPLAPIRSGLISTSLLSPMANRVLSEFLDVHCRGNSHGLPRGVSLSAVLSEYVMQDFDQHVLLHPEVYRYFRFADDILIFSYSQSLDVDSFLNRILPDGLALSPKPEKRANVLLPDQKGVGGFKEFDYLGYDFSLSRKVDREGSTRRNVSAVIAKSKLKRIKTRVIMSLKSFMQNRNMRLLIDRLRYLCSNFAVRRSGLSVQGPKRTIKSGIYYNYRHCVNSEFDAVLPKFEDGLKRLDGFMQNLLFAPSSEFRSAIAARATAAQRQSLKSLSFLAGFQVPMMVKFNSERLAAIKSAWAYV